MTFHVFCLKNISYYCRQARRLQMLNLRKIFRQCWKSFRRHNVLQLRGKQRTLLLFLKQSFLRGDLPIIIRACKSLGEILCFSFVFKCVASFFEQWRVKSRLLWEFCGLIWCTCFLDDQFFLCSQYKCSVGISSHYRYIQWLWHGIFILVCSYTASEVDVGSDKSPEQRALLVESRRWFLIYY